MVIYQSLCWDFYDIIMKIRIKYVIEDSITSKSLKYGIYSYR